MHRLLGRVGQGGRTDDTAEVIRYRLQVFAQTTSPGLSGLSLIRDNA